MKITFLVAVTSSALIILGVLFLPVCFARDDDVAVVEDDLDEVPPSNEPQGKNTERCCTSGTGGLLNAHYVIVSTMDGKITALDANNDGRIAWSTDGDAAPLLAGTLSSQRLTANGHPYVLVPSLDGSLYMFNMESNVLNPIPLNADISVVIGEDAVAGGTVVSTTGVDPISGQIRYQCTSSNCEQTATSNRSPHTLLIQRNTQLARAADPVTGTERWNLSVSEYGLSLVSSDRLLRYTQEPLPTHIRFRLRPPDGVVSAVNNCGLPVWEQIFRSPIARVWQMANGHLYEISLFDSDNVDSIDGFGETFDGNAKLPKFEAPFYFGTVNSEPYIIPSESIRSDLRQFALTREMAHFQPYGADMNHYSRALYLHDLAITSFIKRSYRRANKAIDADVSASTALPRTSENCPMNEAVAVISGTDLQQVGYGDQESGNVGYYVFKPVSVRQLGMDAIWSPPNGRLPGFAPQSGVCPSRGNIVKRIGEKLNANEPVSGWWRVGAVAMLICAITLFSVATVFTRRFLPRVRHDETKADLPGEKSDASKTSTSSPGTQSTEVLASSATVSTPGRVKRPSNGSRSTSTIGSQAAPDLFVSKFLEDFIPEKWLGRGGYGIVFNCRNRIDDRSYAVKRVAVSDTAFAIERVRREAKAMAKLNHPGIIRYFHTWLERPPVGWQQAKDKEILSNIRAIAGSAANTSLFRSSDAAFQSRFAEPFPEKKLVERQAVFKKLTPLVDKTVNVDEKLNWPSEEGLSSSRKVSATRSQSTSGSWADDCSALQNGPKPASSDSDSSESDCSVRRMIVPSIQAAVSGESSGVVFAKASELGGSGGSGEKDQSSSSGPLEPPVVLVAKEADLQTCKKTKDYIYLYIQMELCQELTLHNWLLENNTPSDRDIVLMKNWLAQLVCAIDYIHEQGLIHRDLKPQNIFFSADGLGSLKIGDLGLATNFAVEDAPSDSEIGTATCSRHTGNVGTRLYMSPEQLRGRTYNQKIDVFSLGLIFTEMLIPFTTVMERNVTLTGLQNGIPPKDYLNNTSEELRFILWLTKLEADARPTCREIIKGDYLSAEVRQLGMLFTRDRSQGSANFGRRTSA